MIRILQIHDLKDLKKIFHELKVDPYGIKIMAPKAANYLIRIKGITSLVANILKQEMLSAGGDAAVARDILTTQPKQTDCLIIGNQSQVTRVIEKLSMQPFGLRLIAKELKVLLSQYHKDNFSLKLKDTRIPLKKRTALMGILNLTPDSFSNDGLYQCIASSRFNEIVMFAEKLKNDGADIIDIGGESSRPGAQPLALKEELKRTIPVVKLLAKKIKIPLSIDTYKPEVARQALDNGAVIVNDISGLRCPAMAKIAARYKATVVLMHMQGSPQTMQKKPSYQSVMDEIIGYLGSAVKRATDAGIAENKIIIDPGIGFGKDYRHNLEILKHLKELKVLGKPVLVGPSRKSFIGKILKVPADARIFGTLAASVVAAQNGAQILRVHDVLAVSQALKVAEAIQHH
ncbi:MAG: dihydropteroate synthase [Candidatus Omnitrophota bacterium]|jgi:dihydropteroate synthase